MYINSHIDACKHKPLLESGSNVHRKHTHHERHKNKDKFHLKKPSAFFIFISQQPVKD